MEEYLVQRNMRIAYTAPSHRVYMRTGYSSEPILAEAAANLMQKLRAENEYADNYPKDRIANILKKHVENGLISKDRLGELTGRLLLILAIDCAQEVAQGNWPRWSKAVGVIGFMRSLVGNENYDERIRNCVPDNRMGEAFDDYFKNSVVRFTHFAQVDDDWGVTTDAAFAAFVRGLAIQCHPFQEGVNVVIPVLINKDKPVEEENITLLLISFKNRPMASNVRDVAIYAEQLGCFPEESNAGGIRSYINLTMELGIQPPGPSGVNAPTPQSTNNSPRRVRGSPSQKPVHPRYLIRIYGCSPTVYGVVHDKDVYAHLLHSRPIFTEHPRGDPFVSAVRRLQPFFSMSPDGADHWVERDTVAVENVEAYVAEDRIEIRPPLREGDLESEGEEN